MYGFIINAENIENKKMFTLMRRKKKYNKQ